MKVQIDPETLKEALTRTGRATDASSPLPILGNIHLNALEDREGLLVLSATNLEMGIRVTVRAKVEEPGAATVPFKLMNQLVALIDGPTTLTLDEESQTLRIEGGTNVDSIANVRGLAALEFPLFENWATMPNAKTFELEPADLEKGLARTVFSSKKKRSQPVLEGVYFHNADDRLVLASADGFRLSVQHTGIALPDEWPNLIISRKPLEEVQKALANQTETVRMVVNDGATQVAFLCTNIQIITQLIAGTFPDYTRIIPKTTTTQALVSGTALRQAVRQAQVFAKNQANLVDVTITPLDGDQRGEIIVRGTSIEDGDQTANVMAEVAGESVAIGMSGLYIIEAMKVMGETRVEIKATTSNQPVLLRIDGDDSYTHVIMPMHRGPH